MDSGNMFYILMFIALYFLPGIAAKIRNHQSSDAILLLNLLLGWTVLGWIVALIWAFTGRADLGSVKVPIREDGMSISSSSHVRCPDCRELVRWDARKCKHCGIALIPLDRAPT